MKKTSIAAAPVGQKTPAMYDDASSPSRRASRATDAAPVPKKRESILPRDSSPTRRQSQNIYAPGGGRRESNLYDGQSHQAAAQRYARPSRASIYKHPRPSIGGSYRSGLYSNEDGLRPGFAVENTYHLGPTGEERFSVTKVQRLLDEFLTNYIGGEQYDAQKCSQMALQMSDIIKERIKKMDFRRHKLYCHVVIGQNLGQGVQVSSRCLWDSTNDSSVTATYCNNSLFAVATVFAVYYC